MTTLSHQPEELPVDLSYDEVIARSQDLGRALKRLRLFDLAVEVQRKKDRDSRARLEAEVSRLAEIVEFEREIREVPTRWVADYEAGVARQLREDTRAVLNERALTGDERQQSLPVDVPAEDFDPLPRRGELAIVSVEPAAEPGPVARKRRRADRAAG